MLTVLFVAVGAVIGYYILQELTIAQVMTGILLGVIIVGLAVAQFPTEFLNLAKAVVEHKGKILISWIIIVALALWVLLNVFGIF